MTNDDDYESSFSHDMEFNLKEETDKDKLIFMQDLDDKTKYRVVVKDFETDLIA